MAETPTGLFTDLYELTMLEAALADGTAERPVAFEAFARTEPDGHRWGVMGGTARMIDAILEFGFDDAGLSYVAEHAGPATAAWLEGHRFSGTVTAYPEGELWWAGSPLVTVEGSFGECVLLETVLLSILNHGCSVLTRAAAIVDAAAGATVIEMGSRRIHEAAAVNAARLTWVAGFDSTSNVAAGTRYGVPVAGTAAHAWTLVHDNEVDAFESQLRTLGAGTTLLVDTYDIPSGLDHAVEAAHRLGLGGPGAVRIDSGDLGAEAFRARHRLDDLGATDTDIVVSGDLDIDSIAAMVRSGAPVDGYGVGTFAVAVPPAGVIYKLVEAGGPEGMRPVAKRTATAAKATVGGRKQAWRVRGQRDVVLPVGEPGPQGSRPVAVGVIVDGNPVGHASSRQPAEATRGARRRYLDSRAEFDHA